MREVSHDPEQRAHRTQPLQNDGAAAGDGDDTENENNVMLDSGDRLHTFSPDLNNEGGTDQDAYVDADAGGSKQNDDQQRQPNHQQQHVNDCDQQLNDKQPRYNDYGRLLQFLSSVTAEDLAEHMQHYSDLAGQFKRIGSMVHKLTSLPEGELKHPIPRMMYACRIFTEN